MGKLRDRSAARRRLFNAFGYRTFANCAAFAVGWLCGAPQRQQKRNKSTRNECVISLLAEVMNENQRTHFVQRT